jgi:hypothetical protein
METIPRLAIVPDAPLSRDVARTTETMLEGLERIARRVDEDAWSTLSEAISALGDEEAAPTRTPAELEGLVEQRLTVTERLALVVTGVLGDFNRRSEIVDGALTTTEAAKRLKLSRQGPHDRRRDHQLLGVPHNNDWLFPAWQFDGRTRTGVLRSLPPVLEALAPLEEWDQAFWLATPAPELDDRTPIEALRDPRAQTTIVLLARAAAQA